MKKGTRITLICILSILILAIVALTIFGYVHRFAYADYIDVVSDPNAIVNFNQLAKINSFSDSVSNATTFSYINDYTFSVSGNASARHFIYLLDNVLVPYYNLGDKFYLKINDTEINGLSYGISLGSYTQLYNTSVVSALGSSDHITLWVDTNVGFNGEYTISVQLTNLSAMYGVGNEPNLEECKKIFTADSYFYNSGTAMVANGLSFYEQGYQDAYDTIQQNLTYSLVASDVYNNATKFDLGDYCGEVLKATDPNIYYVYTNPNPTFNDIATYANGFYMPFNATMSGGAIIKLEGCIATYSGFAEQLTPIYCAILSGDQIKNLYTFNNYIVGSGDVGNLLKASYDLTITLPYDCNGLYFYSLEQFACANLSIKVQNFDLQTAIASARLTAQNQAEEYYSALYAEGGERYKQIFNNGVQYSLTHNANNAWGSAWDFIESAFTGIGGIFQVQLIPGVPLSVFILVPLMISLIFFIVKLTKGGGD